MERINTAELLASTTLSEIVSRYVTLKPKGIHQVGLCPFHDDHSSSLTVTDNKGLFKCFACGAGGNAIDFLVKRGATFKEAVAEIQSGGAMFPGVPPKPAPAKKWTPIFPVPADAKKPNFAHWHYTEPASKIWEYRNASDDLLGYLVRFELPGGKKDTLPFTFATDGNRTDWRWLGFGSPRPIYNVKALRDKPAANVIIVEGEKAADAAAILFPALAVITWQGGTNSIHDVDWSPLHGRKIILWPDNDEPGKLAMFGGWQAQKSGPPIEKNGIADILRDHASLKTFRLPPKIKAKWDAADATWTPDQAQEYLRNNLIDIPPHGPAPTTAPENPPLPPPPAGDEPATKQPFKFLGFIKDPRSPLHCFFSEQSKTVIQLAAPGMSSMNLLNLAPLEYWQRTFPMKGKNGFDINGAANWLIAASLSQGIFNPIKIRGRGAWMDEGRVVLHVGPRLIVDGQPMNFQNLKSEFIYEQAFDLRVKTENPLSQSEAARLMDLSRMVKWQRPINAYLLAGWCVIAPVCGALPWRPHIWITGPAGSGKTWVHHSIVKPLLGDMVLSCEAGTTEPAIRQMLMTDGLPVFLDEAEGEDKTAAQRVQNIILLARSASSDSDTSVFKGGNGNGGGPTAFKTRSCFAFSSISPQLTHGADISRFSVLTIDKDTTSERNEKFKALKSFKTKLLTKEYAQRLQARTIKLLPVIIKNAAVFSQAVVSLMGEQRNGDQLGPLLAGAYSLFSNSEISYEKAEEFILKHNFDDERATNEIVAESGCFARIMEHLTNVESGSGRYERSIGELISISEGVAYTDFDVKPSDAKAKMLRLGFKSVTRPDGTTWLHVASRYHIISKILQGTNWQENYAEILARVPGAEKSRGSERFGTGIMARSVMIPMEFIIDKAKAHTPVREPEPGLAEQMGLFPVGSGMNDLML
jgi:putative DNA primase/helicase